jgi:pSer/pThr/pTyr-binding forkhead associated (FHA) protein
MPARLVPLIPPNGPTIPLQRPILLIGRHPDCDIRLELPSISRRHCCLAVAYERLVLRDLGSRNGVRVNGVRTQEAHLESGDEVAIGPLIFRLVDLVLTRPSEGAAAEREPGHTAPAPVDRPSIENDLVPLSEALPPVH